jgi:hypothetical protein
VTDGLEDELARMLHDRVADMPLSHEITPAALARVHRRRAAKLGAFATAVVLVVGGTAAAVTQTAHTVNGHITTVQPSTSVSFSSTTQASNETSTTRPSVAPGTVATSACPINYALTPPHPLPPPLTAARAVNTPGADAFVSYAATTDDRYIVLGPTGWQCSAQVGADGQNGMELRADSRPGTNIAPISIINDYLWHGGVGGPLACSVSDDATIKAYMQTSYPELGTCPRAGRVLTHVDAHTTTFVDPDGMLGAGWFDLPSSQTADDGKVSVLTCHPTSDLSVASCNTIIADWIARVDVPAPPNP